jgi:hypothetical protein
LEENSIIQKFFVVIQSSIEEAYPNDIRSIPREHIEFITYSNLIQANERLEQSLISDAEPNGTSILSKSMLLEVQVPKSMFSLSPNRWISDRLSILIENHRAEGVYVDAILHGELSKILYQETVQAMRKLKEMILSNNYVAMQLLCCEVLAALARSYDRGNMEQALGQTSVLLIQEIAVADLPEFFLDALDNICSKLLSFISD